MAPKPKVYAFDEVAKHNNITDCWIIIHGKVYDLTPFMEDHPGGADILLNSTGKDGTNDFDDVDHSDDAKKMMDQYCIGEIDKSTIPVNLQTYALRQDAYDPDKGREFVIKTLLFIIPLLVLGLAVAVRFYKKD